VPNRSILRKEIRQLRRDLRKADLHSVTVQFKASRREVLVARSELQQELLKLNNLRSEVSTDRALFVTGEKHDADMLRVLDQVRTLRGSRQGGLDAAWGYLIGVGGLLIVGIDVILRATGH
jgi:hypothetical protein